MYRFVLGGVEVTCDTAAELRAALALGSDVQPTTSKVVAADQPFPPTKSPQRKSVPNRSVGVTKSWAMARWRAQEEGCTPEEARSKLADLKKTDFAGYQQIEEQFYRVMEVHKKESEKKGKK